MKDFFRSMNPLLKKAFFLFLFTLILQIPLKFILSLVHERDFLYEKTVAKLGEEWGKTQTIAGPAIVLVYDKPIENPERKKFKSIILEKEHYIILPDNLDIRANLDDEIRSRGIYKSSVYTSNINVIGNFSNILNKIPNNIKIKAAYIIVGMSDTNSLIKINKFNLGDKQIELESGTELIYPLEFKKGIAGKIISIENLMENNLNFEINFELRGNGKISILPIGRNNHFEISSSWKNPSFIGMLPTTKEVSDNGFIAKWDISHLVRNYRQEFLGNDTIETIKDGTAGVALYPGITHYRQVIRSIKYGVLFIMLSLGVVYIFEISSKKSTHYIQYGIVGLSLTLFYLVLLSFSEQISFSGAYIIATLTMVIPNAFYIGSITKNIKYGLGMFIFLIAMYSILFSILQMEEYALITGVLLILGVIYVLMYLTRNLENLINN